MTPLEVLQACMELNVPIYAEGADLHIRWRAEVSGERQRLLRDAIVAQKPALLEELQTGLDTVAVTWHRLQRGIDLVRAYETAGRTDDPEYLQLKRRFIDLLCLHEVLCAEETARQKGVAV